MSRVMLLTFIYFVTTLALTPQSANAVEVPDKRIRDACEAIDAALRLPDYDALIANSSDSCVFVAWIFAEGGIKTKCFSRSEYIALLKDTTPSGIAGIKITVKRTITSFLLSADKTAARVNSRVTNKTEREGFGGIEFTEENLMSFALIEGRFLLTSLTAIQPPPSESITEKPEVSAPSETVTGSDRNAIVRLHELVLPELKLERATVRNGLDTVQKAWTNRYPKESFPVVLIESPEASSDSGLPVTLSLKNVPALTAVTYLAVSAGFTVRHGLDLVILRPVLVPDEGAWESAMLRTSDRVMRALELSPELDGDDAANQRLKRLLESYGLGFDPGFDVRWFGGSKQLYIRNTPQEVSKLKGLLMILDAGYTIRKTAD